MFPLPQLGANPSNCGKKVKAKCAISSCDDGNRAKTQAAQTNFTSVGRIEVTSPGFTYLQTAHVSTTGPTGLSRQTHCLLDGESQLIFIAASLIDDLKLQAINELFVHFNHKYIRSSRRILVRFNINGVIPSLLTRPFTRFLPSQLSHKTLRPWRIPANFN